MNWKPEVFVDGGWYQNALVFATKQEAEDYARDLMRRWVLVANYRAAESSKPVNYTFINGNLEAIK